MTTPDCIDTNHFYLDDDGAIVPQPYMQWRQVGAIQAPSTKIGKYAVTGGGNKNALLHSLQRSWLNDTPLPQWVYGKITRGGCRVTLQARSRGYLQVSSGYQKHASDPGPLAVCSKMGIGADIGRGGTLGIGTTFCVAEERMNSTTFPLAPERVGWLRLEPGETVTAKVEVRFVSDFWENSIIDGGNSGSESGFDSGGTRLDLFAIPVL